MYNQSKTNILRVTLFLIVTGQASVIFVLQMKHERINELLLNELVEQLTQTYLIVYAWLLNNALRVREGVI